MQKITLALLLALTIPATEGLCQKKLSRYFDEPILTDTLSTLFIPTRYNESLISANKIAFWGDYYANIVAYNFKTDTYHKLFDKDVFIASLTSYNYSTGANRIKNITEKWVFLLTKTKDTNANKRIDESDPSVLFAVSTDGQNLKQLTDVTENVVSFEIFNKQGFVLLKIQRDADGDKSFDREDKEIYFRKISLTDLTLGKGIEVK